jgi:alpha-L-fucosidase
LHVFDWPQAGALLVPGIYNEAKQAYLLADENRSSLVVERKEDALQISVSAPAPDSINAVIVLDIIGKPDVSEPPLIKAENEMFIDEIEIEIVADMENVTKHYTLDGTTPTINSPLVTGPIILKESTVVSARNFRDGKAVSGTRQKSFSKVDGAPALEINEVKPEIKYAYFEGDWDYIPNFEKMPALKTGIISSFEYSPRENEEHFGFSFTGFIKIPKDGVYHFFTKSDDGSLLFIGEKMVVDNDGLHGAYEQEGDIALRAGFHSIKVAFFEKTGGDFLEVSWKGPGFEKQIIPASVLFH